MNTECVVSMCVASVISCGTMRSPYSYQSLHKEQKKCLQLEEDHSRVLSELEKYKERVSELSRRLEDATRAIIRAGEESEWCSCATLSNTPWA